LNDTGGTMEWQNKRKPTDRVLDPKLLERVNDNNLFQRMQEVESNLDALVQRKRLDLQDMIGRSMRKNETIRLFISSQIFNQPWQKDTPLFTDESNPNWALRIEGKLLNGDPDRKRPFSSMITSVIVELESESGEEQVEMQVDEPKPEQDAEGSTNQSADGKSNQEIVEWHETCVPPEQRVGFDGLDVKRSGSSPVKATIYIQLKEYPDKFKLSPELATILGISEESKPGAVVSLWQYIRFHNLQDVDEKRLIRCDDALFNLFKREKIMLPHLVELLGAHLSPREPIKIEYTIDPTQDLDNRDIAFDVPIQVDHPLRTKLLDMLNMWHNDQMTLSNYETALLKDIQALNLLEYQREFYEEFAKDPVNFLDKWTDSQMRDLKVIYCDRQFSEEMVRQSSFYSDDLLNANLHLFLDKH